MSRLKKIIFNILVLIIQLNLALSQYNPYYGLKGNRECDLFGSQIPNANLYGSACDNPTCNTCGTSACGTLPYSPYVTACENPLGSVYSSGCGKPGCTTCSNTFADPTSNFNLYGSGFGNPTCNFPGKGCSNPTCHLYANACGNPSCNAYTNPYSAFAQPNIGPYNQPYLQPEPVYPEPVSNQPPVIVISDDDRGDSRHCQNNELYTLMLSSAFTNLNAPAAVPPFAYGGNNFNCNSNCNCNNNCNSNCNCNNDCNCNNNSNSDCNCKCNNNCNSSCNCNNDCNCNCNNNCYNSNNCNGGCSYGNRYNDDDNCNNCNNAKSSPTLHVTIVLPKSDTGTGKPSVTIS